MNSGIDFEDQPSICAGQSSQVVHSSISSNLSLGKKILLAELGKTAVSNLEELLPVRVDRLRHAGLMI